MVEGILRNRSENKLAMTGIILAGGKSSRMGKNKAFLEFEGQSLIERSLDALRSVFSEIIISTNNPELYRQYGEKTVTDLYLEHGPLGGLQACLKEAQYEFSFFVACDMPFLEPKVIRFLSNYTLIGEEWAIVPDVKGRIHPLHAFYHKKCLPVIEKRLEAKRLKFVDIYQEFPVRYVSEGDFEAFPQIERVFSNVNTPQEWLELQHHQA